MNAAQTLKEWEIEQLERMFYAGQADEIRAAFKQATERAHTKQRQFSTKALPIFGCNCAFCTMLRRQR